jgi:zinc resistance-associated protein
MYNRVLALSTAIAIIGSTAVAQQQQLVVKGTLQNIARKRPSADDVRTLVDACVVALKGELQLTPDQEKNWPAFEQAYRNLANLSADAPPGLQQFLRPDSQSIVERLQRRADLISQYGAALKDLAIAATPLYQSFDDAQKHRFVLLTHFMEPRHSHVAMWRHRDGKRGLRDQ